MINNKFSIKIQPVVEDLDGNIIKEYPEQFNLITDYGLNTIGTKDIRINYVTYTPRMSELTRYISLGDDPDPDLTNRGSGSTLLSQIIGSMIVTSDVDFFEVDDANNERTIQFPNSKARIIGYNNARSVNIDLDQSLTNVGAIIWNTEKHHLKNQQRVMSSLDDNSPGNHGTSAAKIACDDGNGEDIIITRWRTLYTETTDSSHTFYEAGWNYHKAQNPMPCIGRIKLDDPIVLGEYSRLKIKITSYQKFWTGHVDHDPIYNAPATIECSQLETTSTYFSSINSSGDTVAEVFNCNFTEPYSNSSASGGIRFWNSAGEWQSFSMSKHTYVTNQFYKRFGMNSYTVMSKDFTELTRIDFGYANTTSMRRNHVSIIYDEPQDKNNDRRLELTVYFTWDRELPDFPT